MTATTITREVAVTEPVSRRTMVESRQSSAQRAALPPLSPRSQLVRSALVLVFVLSAAFLVQLVVLSRLQASSAQSSAFDHFRAQLANGTAPIGPVDDGGHVVSLGASVAFLEIPSIGLRQVVGQGTTSGVLFDGPGHRRDTPLPGQIGSSVIYGRQAAFGGPFADLDQLKPGALIRATTGQGVFQFHVLDIRRAGDVPPPPPAAGAARLQLVTAHGTPFLPDGVLRVDADLDGTAVVAPQDVIGKSDLTDGEALMAGDTSTLWALALWLQALVLLSLGVVWAWHRWGRAQTWIVFVPPLILVGIAVSGEAARLLPNLL